MSLQGVLLIDLMGLGFILLILNLMRKHSLIVGYGIIWISAVAGMMILVSVTPLRDLVTRVVGAEYPASAISLLAFVFIFVVLIYFSVQFSLMSTRQAALIQTIAILEHKIKEKDSLIENLRGEKGVAES